MSLYGIGLTALSAAQVGMATTEHNIANANTPGYRRQQIVQSPAIPQLTGAGFMGQGVTVDTVRRSYSQFLESQLLQAQTTGGYLDAYYSEVRQIDNLLADPNAGLSPAVQNFFNSVQEVASNPSSMPVRQALLSSANTMVGRFNTLYQRLGEIRSGVNSQLEGIIGQINSYATQIAALNDQVVLAQSTAGSTRQPNDLLDQRDQLITELNKLVKVSTIEQTDGSYNIFIGNGQPLVVGNRTFSLDTELSPEDPDNLDVTYASGQLNPSSLTGGSLGALLDFRKGILDEAQNALGRVATALAQEFNNQHSLGVDLSGSIPTVSFFSLGSNAPKVQANLDNTGTATVTASYASDAGALTTSNYRISYNGSTYAYTDLATNTTTSGLTSAQLVTAMDGIGITLSISAGAATGDQWLLMPNRYSARDISVNITNPSEIAAATPISTAATQTNSGTASISTGSVSSTSTLPSAAVTLTYNSGTQKFDLTSSDAAYNSISVPSSSTYTSGDTITVNGISFIISGTPSNGDTFTISPNYGSSFTGVSDGRNALALAQLQTTNTLVNNSAGNPTTTFQGAYSQLASLVGSKTREYEVRSAAQTSLITQVTQEQQAFSGVNLDEEAANLIRYQQAYQAAGKAMQIANVLFQTLLELGQ